MMSSISLIPHFILHTVRHRIALISILVAYLFLGIFIDNYLIFLSNGVKEIVHFVMKNRFYYKLIPVIIYVFVNMAIGLLFAEIYRKEEAMERQRENLVQAEKMASLGNLTAGIAHEINNPLNFISGSLQALQTLTDEYLRLEPGDVPGKEKTLKQIKNVMDSSFEGVNRASDIISSLEFFAHPDIKNKQETNLEKVDRRPFTRISISNSGPAIPEVDLKQIFDPFFSSREAGKGLKRLPFECLMDGIYQLIPVPGFHQVPEY